MIENTKPVEDKDKTEYDALLDQLVQLEAAEWPSPESADLGTFLERISEWNHWCASVERFQDDISGRPKQIEIYASPNTNNSIHSLLERFQRLVEKAKVQLEPLSKLSEEQPAEVKETKSALLALDPAQRAKDVFSKMDKVQNRLDEARKTLKSFLPIVVDRSIISLIPREPSAATAPLPEAIGRIAGLGEAPPPAQQPIPRLFTPVQLTPLQIIAIDHYELRLEDIRDLSPRQLLAKLLKIEGSVEEMEPSKWFATLLHFRTPEENTPLAAAVNSGHPAIMEAMLGTISPHRATWETAITTPRKGAHGSSVTPLYSAFGSYFHNEHMLKLMIEGAGHCWYELQWHSAIGATRPTATLKNVYAQLKLSDNSLNCQPIFNSVFSTDAPDHDIYQQILLFSFRPPSHSQKIKLAVWLVEWLRSLKPDTKIRAKICAAMRASPQHAEGIADALGVMKYHNLLTGTAADQNCQQLLALAPRALVIGRILHHLVDTPSIHTQPCFDYLCEHPPAMLEAYYDKIKQLRNLPDSAPWESILVVLQFAGLLEKEYIKTNLSLIILHLSPPSHNEITGLLRKMRSLFLLQAPSSPWSKLQKEKNQAFFHCLMTHPYVAWLSKNDRNAHKNVLLLGSILDILASHNLLNWLWPWQEKKVLANFRRLLDIVQGFADRNVDVAFHQPFLEELRTRLDAAKDKQTFWDQNEWIDSLYRDPQRQQPSPAALPADLLSNGIARLQNISMLPTDREKYEAIIRTHAPLGQADDLARVLIGLHSLSVQQPHLLPRLERESLMAKLISLLPLINIADMLSVVEVLQQLAIETKAEVKVNALFDEWVNKGPQALERLANAFAALQLAGRLIPNNITRFLKMPDISVLDLIDRGVSPIPNSLLDREWQDMGKFMCAPAEDKPNSIYLPNPVRGIVADYLAVGWSRFFPASSSEATGAQAVSVTPEAGPGPGTR